MLQRLFLIGALFLVTGCFYKPWVEGDSGSSGSTSDTSLWDCYQYGYDDACVYYEVPDPDYWYCKSSSETDDYCEGYCDGELECFGGHYDCSDCN
ncbi:MAG: hypothetical protein QGG40_01715 [Myxococcota bacterium]|nr:hypothetical protein [Myxococcota bacterium]